MVEFFAIMQRIGGILRAPHHGQSNGGATPDRVAPSSKLPRIHKIAEATPIAKTPFGTPDSPTPGEGGARPRSQASLVHKSVFRNAPRALNVGRRKSGYGRRGNTFSAVGSAERSILTAAAPTGLTKGAIIESGDVAPPVIVQTLIAGPHGQKRRFERIN